MQINTELSFRNHCFSYHLFERPLSDLFVLSVLLDRSGNLNLKKLYKIQIIINILGMGIYNGS